MPYYMVLLFNRMIKWLPKPDNSGTMSGRKITCRRLDYWSRIPPRQGNDKFAPRYREVLLCNKCNFLLQLMPYYMVLLFNRMIKWLPKPDNSGTMSGRKITCRRLDYWSRLSHACLSSNKPIMVKPRTAHYNSYNVLDVDYPTWITVAILELIHAPKL
ncbi:hypothetical protein ACO02O_07491 [Dirofilaria immitis]